MARVRVQEGPFDAGREIAALTEGRRDVGAVATFVGLVRDLNEGARVTRMSLETRVSVTAIQTVGHKGYDGFAIALVVA